MDASDVLLGKLGMDVGLLSQVKDQQRIQAEERECFYQLLSVADGLDTAASAADVDIPQLFAHPTRFRGDLLAARGSVRRAVRVRVDDPDIRARFTMDHYYQLDMLVPLRTPLQLVDPRDQTGDVYNSYPVTICVRHLPAGMPVGDPVHEDVQVQAFFLKLWAYRSSARASGAASVREKSGATRPGSPIQFSPLLVGASRGGSAGRRPPILCPV